MPASRHEALHEFVQNRAGESYRASFHYKGDEWEPLYVREDLATRELRERIPQAREDLVERRALVPEEKYPPLGETHATTEIHEHGVIVHIPEGPREGTVISLDRQAARRITGFVVRCRSVLESPDSERFEAAAAADDD